MKDILLIGGPASITGVDRIDDDLLSILAEDNLHSRQAVIVWPTKAFLSVPSDPKLLEPLIDVVGFEIPIQNNMFRQTTKSDVEQLQKRLEVARADQETFNATLIHSAISEAIYRLSRIMLDLSGGLRLALVVGKDAPDHSLCWTGLVQAWKSSSQMAVKKYDTKSIGYGALNAVKDWGLEFGSQSEGRYQTESLLPIGEVEVCGQPICIDADWYEEVSHALAKEVSIAYPVSTRAGNAMAVQVDSGDGFMLVVPEPDKPKNFRIGLVAGGSVTAGAAEAVDAPKPIVPKSRPASKPDDEYVTVMEAAELLKCSDKTIRNYYGDGRLEHKKVGQRKILILKSSVDALLEGKE